MDPYGTAQEIGAGSDLNDRINSYPLNKSRTTVMLGLEPQLHHC